MQTKIKRIARNADERAEVYGGIVWRKGIVLQVKWDCRVWPNVNPASPYETWTFDNAEQAKEAFARNVEEWRKCRPDPINGAPIDPDERNAA